jgi:hypothetical protein
MHRPPRQPLGKQMYRCKYMHAHTHLHLSLHFQLVQLICVCAMCVGFALMKGLNIVSKCVYYFGEPTSTL